LEYRGIGAANMMKWSRDVTSGDPKNLEGRAAAFYWANVFRDAIPSPLTPLPKGERKFIRDRFGEPPNNLLNYGYAILRAVVARALVTSGLLPTFGIHHHNKYNAYSLADDIMEPYRPFVDALVCAIVSEEQDIAELTPALKRHLLGIPTLDVTIEGNRRPLMIAVSHTTASLAKCFLGERRKLTYPSFIS
ncbi:MAG: type II CRISPR-associated endonuclease Cas1, partial [Thermodesulfobacteriota bacterium]